MTKKLKRGFYWVRTVSGWTVAQLSPFYDGDDDYSSWYICGNECAFSTGDLEEINETTLAVPATIPQRTTIVSIPNQMGGQYGR